MQPEKGPRQNKPVVSWGFWERGKAPARCLDFGRAPAESDRCPYHNKLLSISPTSTRFALFHVFRSETRFPAMITANRIHASPATDRPARDGATWRLSPPLRQTEYLCSQNTAAPNRIRAIDDRKSNRHGHEVRPYTRIES